MQADSLKGAILVYNTWVTAQSLCSWEEDYKQKDIEIY